MLQDGFYADSLVSRTFSDFPLLEIIPQFVKRGQIEVMSSVRRAFQQWVIDQLKGYP